MVALTRSRTARPEQTSTNEPTSNGTDALCMPVDKGIKQRKMTTTDAGDEQDPSDTVSGATDPALREAKVTAAKSTLFDLPLELREKIYREAFKPNANGSKISSALLRTCRMVRDEAERLFLADKCIKLRLWYSFSNSPNFALTMSPHDHSTTAIPPPDRAIKFFRRVLLEIIELDHESIRCPVLHNTRTFALF